MNLNVYHFCLPMQTNDGTHDYQRALTVWEQLAIDEGGYTDLGERMGAWRNDAGCVMQDVMQWYEVACSEEAASRLMKAAMDLFPDQESFYVSKVGTANVVINEARVQPVVGTTVSSRQLPPLYTRTAPGTYERPPCFAGKFPICTGENLQNG